MGVVWAAEDELLGRRVAVKVLGEALAGDGRAAERLRREARSAARLVHPNIARVLDLGEQDGRPYLVMELLEGESLAARIARDGAMAPAEAAAVAAAIADALEAAHRAGVVHRDVKPGNVFVTRVGEVKVLDFGIASAAGEAALTTGDLLGTAAYLAPERALGRPATPAADVYALGVLVYELLAGRRPFQADSDIELAMAHLNARPEPLDQVAPWVPASLAAACAQAMAKDPSARPPSAAAFAALLRNPPRPRAPGPAGPATRPLPVGRHTITRPLGGRRRGRRRGVVLALLLGAALLAAPALGERGLSWVGLQVERPPAVPGADTPATTPGQDGGAGRAAGPENPASADDDLPPGADPAAGGGDGAGDRDDSGGSGRSGGGGDSGGGGGSSGPG
jgi:serine/threonine-protein kinase